MHQAPHDYFRYTRHGLELLLRRAGFSPPAIEPIGGFFRLLSRRLLNGVQHSPLLLSRFIGLVFIPPALLLPAARFPRPPPRLYTGVSMLSAQVLILGLLSRPTSPANPPSSSPPRPSPSDPHPRLSRLSQALGLAGDDLKSFGYQVIEDHFTAKDAARTGPDDEHHREDARQARPRASPSAATTTPRSSRSPFVGANDAGSSTGAVLELARCLKDTPTAKDIYFVFFDGEEAFGEWTLRDSLYGTRHLSALWEEDGTLRPPRRAHQRRHDRRQGSPHRRRAVLLRGSAPRCSGPSPPEKGYTRHFDGGQFAVEDDHVPYLRLGVRALNLIDFSYGPDHKWWHTPEDTMDKVSPQSLQIVGSVVAETLLRLDRQ